MKRLFFASTLLCLTLVCHAQNTIEGVWSANQFPNWHDTFTLGRGLSWGTGVIPRVYTIIVDMHSDPPRFEISGIITGRIVSVIEKDSAIELTFMWPFFDGHEIQEFDVIVFFRFNKNGSMWIESTRSGSSGEEISALPRGRDTALYRIDGPESDMAMDAMRRSHTFSKTHTITGTLPLRKRDCAESPVLMVLPADSDIQLIVTRGMETIDSITAPWAGVVTEDGTLGWLFSSFLKPVAVQNDVGSSPWLLLAIGGAAVIVIGGAELFAIRWKRGCRSPRVEGL